MRSWAVGDLALYTGCGCWVTSSGDPTIGPGVGFIGEVTCLEVEDDYLGLGFVEWSEDTYDARLFVRIDPLTDDEKRKFEADLRHEEKQRDPALAGTRLPEIKWRSPFRRHNV